MKTSEAFRKAKQLLQPIGTNQFICHALYEAAYSRSPHAVPCEWEQIFTTRKSGYKTAIKTITKRIGNSSALEDWLAANDVSVYRYKDDQRHDLMQAYRHRWLDALIAEFEAKGD